MFSFFFQKSKTTYNFRVHQCLLGVFFFSCFSFFSDVMMFSSKLFSTFYHILLNMLLVAVCILIKGTLRLLYLKTVCLSSDQFLFFLFQHDMVVETTQIKTIS